MPQFCTLQLKPEILDKPEEHKRRISRQLGIAANRINHIKLIRRSIDARKRKPLFVLRFEVWVDEMPPSPENTEFPLQNVSNAEEVHIVGMGPAGLFAALHLIKLGLKPVIIERGKAVRERRRDLANLTREGVVNPDSNYCFGEGGAGTFSDGKLYTRSAKRGNTRQVLETLVQFGATEEILIDAHPHIGTNKLPAIIQRMREKIVECGGEVLFETKLTNIEVEADTLKRIQLNGKEWINTKKLILATGHSARDIFQILHQNKLEIQAKAFALGLRVEHPQELIDQIQYHCEGIRHPNLPAASYALVRQIEGQGVYSFCMCPGGIICPAATQEGEVVVNGWSPSKRNTGYANSGIVAELRLEDFMKNDVDPLQGVAFQQQIEQLAFKAGGGKQVAPAQRLTDFIRKKASSSLPSCSYLPGITSTELGEVLPTFVQRRLQKAFKVFGNKLKGYMSHEAVVLGVESRTSSPIRIPRDPNSLSHPQAKGLIPCGEGAGYAGGIMSAAMDGIRCAEACKPIPA